MNDYLLSVVLGVIEGLTEFLPVSSTAHLRIAEWLFKINLADGYWKMYTIVIQLGAILCLPIYFRRRILDLLATFPRGARGDRTLATHPLTLVAGAFVATAVPAFLLAKVIGEHLENLAIMGGALVAGGLVMWAVDARHAAAEAAGPSAAPTTIRTWSMDAMSPLQALWIGLCQVLAALFPGASRSMTTIAAGQVAGLSREAALEFSFFLSIPTMVVATGYDLIKSLRGGENPVGAVGIDAHGFAVLAIGFGVSFLVAWGAVAWFMAWVRRRGFVPFAIYRIVLGGLVLWLAMKFPR